MAPGGNNEDAAMVDTLPEGLIPSAVFGGKVKKDHFVDKIISIGDSDVFTTK